jgi:hypothetical protein
MHFESERSVNILRFHRMTLWEKLTGDPWDCTLVANTCAVNRINDFVSGARYSGATAAANTRIITERFNLIDVVDAFNVRGVLNALRLIEFSDKTICAGRERKTGCLAGKWS